MRLDRTLRALAVALSLTSCSVQTNVTRPAPEESGEQRATPAPAPAPAPSPSPSASSSPPALVAESPQKHAVAISPPVSITAAPCASAGRHLSLAIPSPGDLDPSFRGAVPGVEIRRTVVSASGTGGWRNATREADVLEVDVWSRGSGIAVGALGSESCKGGDPAEVRFEFIGHYVAAAGR